MEKQSGYPERAAIIGAGAIGSSLAVLFTIHGFKTTILTTTDESIARGKKIYQDYMDSIVSEGLMSKSEAGASASLLNYTLDYKDISDAEFVYESVAENPEVKWGVYQKLEKHCPDIKAIASATSSITADVLVQGAGRYSDRIMVAHPWNPPHMVSFVEMLADKDTSAVAIDYVKDLLEHLGRKVILMRKPAPGFIGNRLQHAMFREAVHMVEQGIALPEDIDTAITYGFAPRYTNVGLFEHHDNAGMELVRQIDDNLFPSLSNADKTQDSVIDMIKEGNLGAKSGQGFYRWDEAKIQDFRKRTSVPYYPAFHHTGGKRQP